MKGSALATTSTVSVRTSEPPRLQPLSRLREIAGDREILANLVRKEVKVKYKSSVLGAAWSMLNPILYLAVFSLVFTVVLANATPHFPVVLALNAPWLLLPFAVIWRLRQDHPFTREAVAA